MQTLESLAQRISLPAEKVEASAPGAFVEYRPVKQMSADVSLASSGGIISKTKIRSPEKAIYEFLMLDILNRVADEYSKANDITFRVPKPIGMQGLNTSSPVLFMDFLNGYELKKINHFKRTTPVAIKGQKFPLPLYPAVALHLGALNRMKEQEGIFHSDYDSRHIIIGPVQNAYIGMVDVENARSDLLGAVASESKFIFDQFGGFTCSPKDKQTLDSWYQQGYESLKTPTEGLALSRAVEEVSRIHDISLDIENMILNGVHLRSHT